jgi:putative acetyltransferase
LIAECSLCRHSLKRIDHVVELGVSVHPDWQTLGAGRLLSTAALDWARAQTTHPIHRIELRVFADNNRAVILYESLGFEHEGRRRDYIYYADIDEYADDLIMGMLL